MSSVTPVNANRNRPIRTVLLGAGAAAALIVGAAPPAAATTTTSTPQRRPLSGCVTHGGTFSGGLTGSGIWSMSSCASVDRATRTVLGYSKLHRSEGLSRDTLYSVVSLLITDRTGRLIGFSQPRRPDLLHTWSAPLRGTNPTAAGTHAVMMQAQRLLFAGAMPTPLLAAPSVAEGVLTRAVAAHQTVPQVLATLGPAAQATCLPPYPCPILPPTR
jgi:hypothetical protein